MSIRQGRKNNELRKITIQKNVMENAYSSILIQAGGTKVLCTVSIEKKTPEFINENEMGWLTAEYNMLPGSTNIRKQRTTFKPDGRNVEIQRIIGRALRACIDLKKIKGYSIIIDCDVIQADGGTRTLSITGSYIVLKIAANKMLREKLITKNPVISQIAAVSAGIINNEVLLDLDYSEDSNAMADFNVVMNEKGNFIEIQGTAEKSDIQKESLLEILQICQEGIKELFIKQNEILKEITF